MRGLVPRVVLLTFSLTGACLSLRGAAGGFRSKCQRFRAECDSGQDDPRDAVTKKPLRCNCSVDKAWYFAAQTVSTVGYGAGLNLQHKEMRRHATYWSLVGAGSFSLVVAALFWLVQGILKTWFPV